MTQIKVCGITSSEMAAAALGLGANYIGLVFCKNSKRCVETENAISIAKTIQENGGTPVGVFTQADAADIISICEKTGIQHVQLHGDNARDAITTLPSSLHKIYVITYSGATRGEMNPTHLHALHPEQDFFLFDHTEGGSGCTIDWSSVMPPLPLRFFLAGGLNASNVNVAIATCQPFAVDVSSGVEEPAYQKSSIKIHEFITAVRNKAHG